MTGSPDHPLVLAYLRRFDVAAARLPEPRRAELRREVGEDLRESTVGLADDAEVRRAIARFGAPAAIVAAEADDPPALLRPAWIVGGALMIVAVVIDYAQPWVPSLPVPVPVSISTLAWAAGALVLALAPGSVTARRPLGTAALTALGIWVVAASIASGIIGRSIRPDDPGPGPTVFGYVDLLTAFLLALIAVVQIARIEVVPRPWRWAPAWVLGAVAVSWVLQLLVAATVGADGAASLSGGLAVLDAFTRVGGVLVLGAISVGLGAGVLRRPARA